MSGQLGFDDALFERVPSVEEQVCAFERNLLLRASAGTGKTEALTTLYVHLVAGATSLDRAVSPPRIVALTFTEKAAAEMRERIGDSLRWLAGRGTAGPTPRSATVVRDTASRRRQKLPLDRFVRALDVLSEAPITTLHAWCASLLRRVAFEAGVDPAFEVLEEREATRLLDDALIGAVRERLAAGDPAVPALLGDLGGLHGPNERGLVPALRALRGELAETATEPGSLLAGTPYAAADHVSAEAWRRLGVPDDAGDEQGRLSAGWDTLLRTHETFPDRPGVGGRSRAVYERVGERARQLRDSPRYGGTLEDLVWAASELEAACGAGRAAGDEAGKRARQAARDLYLLSAGRERAHAIVSILEAGEARYEEAKRRAAALDFSDLVRRARDVLRDRPGLRREIVASIDALLVDEFQDTNAVQRDLVYLLRAREDVGVAIPGALELQPRGLFVVGDRKQSIYGFRNADVAVFEQVAADIVRAGGRELSLRRSFRSTRPLVDALNELSAAALTAQGTERYEFEIELDPGSEALTSGVDALGAEPPVERLSLPDCDDPSDAEPIAIAGRLADLVDGRDPIPVRGRDGAVRPAALGDVAVLLPRFTHLHRYLRALDRAMIPYLVIKGRGLMSTVEARDVVSLSRVLTGVADGAAVAAVLRSPWVGVSDVALLGLSRQGDLRRAFERDDTAAVLRAHGADDEAVRRLGVVGRLRDGVDRLGLGTCLRLALEDSGYAAIAAGLPAGAQRVANLDRIVGEVVARELDGEDGRRVLADLVQRSRDEREPEADIATEESDAVRVMTVHQSKGLQFPVVVAADLGRRLDDAPRTAVEHDRRPGAGLAVAVRGSGQFLYSSHHQAVNDVRRARERAERLRLFYVQITRARDRLILVGRSNAGSIAREVVDDATLALSAKKLLRVVDAPTDEGASRPRSVDARAPVDLDALAARAAPARPRVSVLEVPVTQLEDFAACPRRFRARHVLQLPEHPRRVPEPVDVDHDPSVDPRRRGTDAHRVLELLELDQAAEDPERALARALARAGVADDAALRSRLRPYVAGDFVRSLRDTRVFREIPFSMRIEDAGDTTLLVRGQIDLLLEGDDGVDVIDYKVTEPRGDDPTERFHFQLSTYAAAVERAVGHAPVRAAVQFLDGRSATPLPAAVDPAGVRRRLPLLGAELVEATRTGTFEGRELGECRRLGCGYTWACHAAAAEA